MRSTTNRRRGGKEADKKGEKNALQSAASSVQCAVQTNPNACMIPISQTLPDVTFTKRTEQCTWKVQEALWGSDYCRILIRICKNRVDRRMVRTVVWDTFGEA